MVNAEKLEDVKKQKARNYVEKYVNKYNKDIYIDIIKMKNFLDEFIKKIIQKIYYDITTIYNEYDH